MSSSSSSGRGRKRKESKERKVIKERCRPRPWVKESGERKERNISARVDGQEEERNMASLPVHSQGEEKKSVVKKEMESWATKYVRLT
jgi:hypothetical protein